jgi:hypothetical protein
MATVKRVRKASPWATPPSYSDDDVFQADDYETEDWSQTQSRRIEALNDELEELDSIAEAALRALDDNGIIEALLLQNDAVREWWAPRKQAIEDEKLRKATLAKLSDDERRVLGLD